MKMNASVKLNLQLDEAKKKVEGAVRKGLRDTAVAIHGESMRKSPKRTGNNMRSIAAEVSGMGTVADGGNASPERMVNDSKLEAAVYSTSGYGGYLETGTVRMAARPYFRPALDKHKDKLIPNIKEHLG
jgi:HK97 gp10 family phage protein